MAVSSFLRRSLRSPEFAANFAIFHQRYSTNTQPSWQLAQPFRYVAHNGEINTVISNRRWLRARERDIRKRIGVGKWFHLLEENVSDSASFDNALEIKLLEGKSVEASMLALVPPAFRARSLSFRGCARRAGNRCRDEAEPWDGPAALVFSDGSFRWREAGSQRFAADALHRDARWPGDCRLRNRACRSGRKSRIAERHRLGPGEMILANPDEGRSAALARTAEECGAAISPQDRFAAESACIWKRQRAAFAAGEPKRVAGAAGWSDDQYKILFRPLLKRQGSRLEHGRRRASGVSFDAAAAAVGLLQAALRAGDQSADRSAARVARDVAGSASGPRPFC